MSSEALCLISLDEDKAQDWDTTITQLLVCMAKVAHHALDCGWRNCGAFSDLGLLWLWPLYNLFCRDRYNGGSHRAQILFPHELIIELARCRDAGLLTGDMDFMEDLSRESQRLSDRDDTAEPASVHGTHTPDAEPVCGALSFTHASDPLSISRLTSSIPQSSSRESFAQANDHTEASIVWLFAPVESIPDEPLPPVSTAPSLSSLSDVLATVSGTPASSRNGPAPSTLNLPLDLGEVSTPAATVTTRAPADGTHALQYLRVYPTQGNAIAATTQDDIELHEFDSSQTIHAQSQALLVKDKREHAGYTTTFSTNDSGPSAVPPDTNNLVRCSPTFVRIPVNKHIINQMMHNNEEPNSHQASASPSASFASAIPQSDSPPTHPPSSSPEPSAPPRDGAGCSLDALSSELSLDDGTTPDVGACRPADSLFVDNPRDVPLPFVSTAGADVRPGA